MAPPRADAPLEFARQGRWSTRWWRGGGGGGDLEASEEEASEDARRVVLAAGDTVCRRCGVWYKKDENSDDACMTHDGEMQSWDYGCWKVSDPQRRSIHTHAHTHTHMPTYVLYSHFCNCFKMINFTSSFRSKKFMLYDVLKY